jgi:hypothetical protein
MSRQIRTQLTKLRTYIFVLLLAVGIILIYFGYRYLLEAPWLVGVMDRLAGFTTIFLGIFIEALPFLLLGALASGLVEIFISPQELSRLAPQRPLPGALAGSLMGLFIPVSENGVVPLVRQLFSRGFPAAAAFTFLLAAPVVNLIVIASTAAAFGIGPMLYLRVGLSVLVAIFTGLMLARRWPGRTSLPPFTADPTYSSPTASSDAAQTTTRQARLQAALMIAVDEFFDMGRYLVLGALLAALLQTLIPPAALLGISQGPVISVLVLMLLAVLLSAGSTVDAFIALSFVGLFSPGAILAFLVFGPVVDLKNMMMYRRVFTTRTVAGLISLPFLLIFASGVLINLLWVG